MGTYHFTDEERAQHRAYYWNHREESLARVHRYQEANRADINAKRRLKFLNKMSQPVPENGPIVRLFSEPEKAWLAAAIDGEGCVSTFLDKWDHLTMYICVVNTDYGFCKRVLEIVQTGRVRLKSKRAPPRKPAFEWYTTKRQAMYEILTQVIPYLIIKKRKAIDVCRLIELRMGRRKVWRVHRSPEEIALEERLGSQHETYRISREKEMRYLAYG